MYLADFRGILLKDLVAIDAQGKDYSPDQRINMNKYRLLWTTLSGIRAAQMCSTGSLTVDTDHMRILRVSHSDKPISLGEFVLSLPPGGY